MHLRINFSNMCRIFMLSLFFVAVNADNVLDVEDILDDKFMPGSLLVLEGTDSYANTTKEESVQNVLDGSFFGAYSTMGFHRQKMNEYLCRSYVADQILTDMSINRIRKRLGQPTPMSRNIPNKAQAKMDIKPDIKEKLLFDEGSSNYKQWLKKSMTLEDIYRQIKERESTEDEKDSQATSDNIGEEFEGEITGFAMPIKNHNIPDRTSPSKMSVSSYGHSGMGGSYGSGGVSGHGGSYDYTPHNVHYVHSSVESHGKDKDTILSDLFEIALTAIAFISFGCFILQVIMCISMASNTTTTAAMTMMPMMMPSDDNPTEVIEPLIYDPIQINNKVNFDSSRGRKVKRDLEMGTNAAMNELSRRVLLSIEAAMVTEQDDGNCLRRKLCEDNRYSRTLSDNQRIWIPVWSFGMSWLSGRLSLKISPATAMLDTLKASILGLGDGNCEILYNNCTLQELRENRRKK